MAARDCDIIEMAFGDLRMTMQKPSELEKQRAAYRATAEALEILRVKRLGAMTEKEAQGIMRTLTVAETPWRERRDWSGLVEQQAIFHRRR
jgi:hypothetical protein